MTIILWHLTSSGLDEGPETLRSTGEPTKVVTAHLLMHCPIKSWRRTFRKGYTYKSRLSLCFKQWINCRTDLPNLSWLVVCGLFQQLRIGFYYPCPNNSRFVSIYELKPVSLMTSPQSSTWCFTNVGTIVGSQVTTYILAAYWWLSTERCLVDVSWIKSFRTSEVWCTLINVSDEWDLQIAHLATTISDWDSTIPTSRISTPIERDYLAMIRIVMWKIWDRH